MPSPLVRKATLDVYLLGSKVGVLDYTSHHNEMHFRYEADYLDAKDPLPLSFSLPLQAAPFDSDRTTVYFENLLPPDQVRKKLGPILHLSHHNIFGFLEAIGGDCAGAISLWAPGQTPGSGREELKELDEDEASEVLRSIEKRPLFVNGVDGYRISGAGAQNKLIARLRDGKVLLPLFGTPSTHIIKPAVADYPDSVYNECFAMKLAERLGLKAARCGILRLKGVDYYWTERFDREVVDGRVCRLHQEDFCQILGISAEVKYESEGGPSFRSSMDAMREMKLSLADRFAFVDRVVYNWLIGNADAHGKNSSVLYRGSRARSLAPLYDVLSTEVYGNLSRVNAMSVGGARRLEDVSRASLAAMAQEVGMKPSVVLNRADRLADVIVPTARKLARELARDWPSEVYPKIVSVIEKHCRQITQV